ncbi:hypothetical protein WIS52_30790 [Pseudonocardia nematodicida]|uniref:Uncharacterized protein n=1 Tax=Pseudonocardia nematodicida TaxID=1206997 RepID=A0ABV1KKA2_9PSEU
MAATTGQIWWLVMGISIGMILVICWSPSTKADPGSSGEDAGDRP